MEKWALRLALGIHQCHRAFQKLPQDDDIHASISIYGVELAGVDLVPEQHQKPTIFYVFLSLTIDAQVKSTFTR